VGVRTLRPAVFFDRDGVLNDAVVRDGRPYPPASVDQLRVDGYARAAVESLRARGFVTVIITNQPDVARGSQTVSAVEAINHEVQARTGVDAIYVCYHDDGDDCDCRKPKPGLILRASADMLLDPGRSFLVGDRRKDVLAGSAAGCATVFIDRGYAENVPSVSADLNARSLEEAVELILHRERKPA